MQQWHIIYTKPNQEPLVNRQLEDRDIETYLPFLQFERGYGRGIRLEAFFPHYVFMNIDLGSPQANGVQWLAGVRAIVHFDDQPAVVPSAAIDVMRKRLSPYAHKVLRKTEWLFKPSDPVLVTAGPFQGMDAIFQQGLSGGQRAQILLKLLGTWVRADVDISQIKPVGTHSPVMVPIT